MLRTVLPITALLTVGLASALAQTSPPPPPQPPRPVEPAKPGVVPAGGTTTTTEGGQAYRVKQILGTKVSIKGDLSIGTVDDVVFSDAGQVEYLIVNNDGKLVTVPWEAAKFDFGKRTAAVEISREQYQAIPTYTTTEYPVFFEPTYRTRVYGWYGLKPRPWHR